MARVTALGSCKPTQKKLAEGQVLQKGCVCYGGSTS